MVADQAGHCPVEGRVVGAELVVAASAAGHGDAGRGIPARLSRRLLLVGLLQEVALVLLLLLIACDLLVLQRIRLVLDGRPLPVGQRNELDWRAVGQEVLGLVDGLQGGLVLGRRGGARCLMVATCQVSVYGQAAKGVAGVLELVSRDNTESMPTSCCCFLFIG